MRSTYQELYKLVQNRITHYRNDLTIDKEQIDENPEVPYIHTSRDTGTFLYLFHPASWYPKKGERVKFLFGYADRVKLLYANLHQLQADLKERGRTIYFCNPRNTKRIRKINEDEALRLMRDYIYQITAQWEREGKERAA